MRTEHWLVNRNVLNNNEYKSIEADKQMNTFLLLLHHEVLGD